MGPQETRRALRSTMIGLAGLAVFGLVLYIMATAHKGLPFRETTTAKAAFTNVDALKSGDDVRQNSVHIGQVDDVEFADGVAVVTMELDGDKPVYNDATAEIQDFSTLGAKFVELNPGSPRSGPLGNRVISAERTEDSADLHQFYGVFDKPTREAAASATREFGGGIAGHGGDLQDLTRSMAGLLNDFGTVSEVLSSERADLPALLRANERLAARFVGRERQITAAVEQTDATFRAMSVDNAQPLGETLRRLPATLDDMRTAFDSLHKPLADTERAFSDLRPGAEALSAAERGFRGFLRDGVRPFGKTPKIAGQAEPALRDFTRTFADARPLAPKLVRFFDDFAEPASVFAPYAPEAGQLFVRGQSWSSESFDGVQYARLSVDSGLRTAAGSILPGTIPQNYYPEPGEADHDRAGANLGGGR